MDNASSHKKDKIQEMINKDNKVLYLIPYQHYCNSIEQYFSILKATKEIPKEHYYNIFKGNYVRDKETTEKNKKSL
jgi:hypothetical protein